MLIKPGLKGIKAFLAGPARFPNWHLFVNGVYLGYTTANAETVIECLNKIGYTLIDFTGNGLHFEN